MSWKLCEWSEDPKTWAVFDTMVDRFIFWEATRDEVRQEYLRIERQRAEEAFERFMARGPTTTKELGLKIQRRLHGPLSEPS